ncbi:MAG: CarD family transcriptional regulator [Clostridiaceae bacterium]|nr:CarD family transcriptional regulator [Clostridiaceae bacterium]
MYSPGDMIVHPMHGAGRIEEIVEQKLSGETRRYYVLQIPTGNVRVMVPVDGCETIGIRPLIGADEAQAVLEDFAKIEVDPVQNWNRRYRENMLRLKSGKLREVSCVVKSLMVREAEHGLSTGERKMLTTAKQILLSELVLATNESYEALERTLKAGL